MKITEEEAEYFDNCDECGEVIDHSYMYNILMGGFEYRLCYSCLKDLKHEILKIDE